MQLSSSLVKTKSNAPTDGRFIGREMPRRIAHGGMGWSSSSPTNDVKLYQPQDGITESRSRIADIASRLRKMAGEPEDARITGGTRSLMRRLSGLNMGMSKVRLAKPVAAKSVIKNLQLGNANVA